MKVEIVLYPGPAALPGQPFLPMRRGTRVEVTDLDLAAFNAHTFAQITDAAFERITPGYAFRPIAGRRSEQDCNAVGLGELVELPDDFCQDPSGAWRLGKETP